MVLEYLDICNQLMCVISQCDLTDFVVLSGWISALTGLNHNVPVGIIMILIAALFTSLAVLSLIMFKKVSCIQKN